MHIFLIGFMGAGKSTVAKELQMKTNRPLIEMDERIVKEQGRSINDIFEKEGEETFRKIESELVETILTEEDSIVSCGGGVVVRQVNVDNMKKNGAIIFLTATPQTVYDRVKGGKDRPILNGNMNVEYIASLMEKRRNAYEQAADAKVATDGKSVEEICNEILEWIKNNG